MKQETIWFSSDFHYNHRNLVKGISSWTNKAKCRDFETLNEHNDRLVKNINSCVEPNDTLYFLGDWSFGSTKDILDFRNRLICKNIHIILGNHDKAIKQKQRELIGHNKFVSISQIKEIKIDDQLIVLCHFPMRTWEKAHKGSWMLHGHCHGTMEKHYRFKQLFSKFFIRTEVSKTMDVGIDTHPQFKPYSYEAIKQIMDKRSVFKNIDHHND
jgi:calcineurin-like phosphoesterase family protein